MKSEWDIVISQPYEWSCLLGTKNKTKSEKIRPKNYLYHPKKCKKIKLKMHESMKHWNWWKTVCIHLLRIPLHILVNQNHQIIRISNSGFIIAHIKQKEYLLTSIVLSLSLSQYQLTIISINLSLIKFPPTGNHSRIPNITSSKCSRISNKSYKTII